MDRATYQSSTFFCFLSLWAAACLPGAVAASEAQGPTSHVVIDGVSYPFDKPIVVVGPCLTTDSFELRSSEAQASLLGLRIDGRANQEHMAFQLLSDVDAVVSKLRDLQENGYYKVVGRIAGARMSGPNRCCLLIVERIEGVPASPLLPADFLDRAACFEGVAAASGVIQVHGVPLRLDGTPDWPVNVIGKLVCVNGTVKRVQQEWQLTKPEWKLVNLADMVDQEASLDGSLWSLNGHWWFNYRGEKLYLTGVDRRPLVFANNDHGRQAMITGELVRQLRPSLDQISAKVDRDLVPTYVVRNARVTFHDESSTWHDRFGPVYATQPPVRDGVPELLAEGSYRRNLLGNETDAMLFVERNLETIHGIVHSATPEVRDVLARRMIDAQVDPTLQLLYAAMLARVNDVRGREWLLTKAESPGRTPQKDIYYCLGIFPFLGGAGNKSIAADCTWAEKRLIATMSNPKTAEAAATYSSIPAVLAKINSPAAQRALLDYALRTGGDPQGFFSGPSVLGLLCQPSVDLPAEDLLRLEEVTKDQGSRRTIMRALLNRKHPAAAERFLDDLEDGFVYMDFRDASSPEVLAILRPRVPELTGQAKSNVQMLLALGAEDPVQALLAMLDDPISRDKNLVMFELARLADPRAVAPVARVLREASQDYFADSSELAITSGVEHALSAIANGRSRVAVRELIELLDTDLGRFGGYIDRAGLQRVVAAQLIEMTGESFGVDQAGWRKWEQAQPDARFNLPEKVRYEGESLRTGPDARVDLAD